MVGEETVRERARGGRLDIGPVGRIARSESAESMRRSERRDETNTANDVEVVVAVAGSRRERRGVRGGVERTAVAKIEIGGWSLIVEIWRSGRLRG